MEKPPEKAVGYPLASSTPYHNLIHNGLWAKWSFAVQCLQPEPAPEVKEEDRRKRQGRVRLYRGNMHLIQKANKEAAKSAMKGSKPKSGKKKKKDKQAGGRQKQRLIVSRLLRKVFGAWAQDEVILSDERSKAAVEALDRKSDTYACMHACPRLHVHRTVIMSILTHRAGSW